MKIIIRKAGMSLLSGAAYVLGSWATKLILKELTKKESNQQNTAKDTKITPA